MRKSYDLIFFDHTVVNQAELVFVEVRLRNQIHFVSGAESISRTKQKRLAKTAAVYLRKRPLQICRFDVVDIVHLHQSSEKIDWIKNAFSVNCSL